MALNKTDPKKSKYTMTVLADDKSIEKKDKTAGEPVQFYVKGSCAYVSLRDRRVRRGQKSDHGLLVYTKGHRRWRPSGSRSRCREALILLPWGRSSAAPL